MKRELKFLVAITCTATLGLLAGCQSGEPEVTNKDKENIERLHRDGIGRVMAEDAKKKGLKGDVSLANPTGGPGPEAHQP